MALLIGKYAITALVVVLASEIAKRSDRFGALLASLPIVTILVLVWLFLEKQPTEKLANHSFYTFWYVLPTLPMFLVLPTLLRKGLNFWVSLVISAAITLLCFGLIALLVKRIGIDLLPK
jgi:hypothetical protein